MKLNFFWFKILIINNIFIYKIRVKEKYKVKIDKQNELYL